MSMRRVPRRGVAQKGMWLQSTSADGARTYIYRYSYVITGIHGQWMVSFDANRETELYTGSLPPPTVRSRPSELLGFTTSLEEAKNLADEHKDVSRPRTNILQPKESIRRNLDDNYGVTNRTPYKKVSKQVMKIRKAYEYGARADKGFDAGEFSGPASARSEEKEIDALLQSHGWSSEDYYEQEYAEGSC